MFSLIICQFCDGATYKFGAPTGTD